MSEAQLLTRDEAAELVNDAVRKAVELTTERILAKMAEQRAAVPDGNVVSAPTGDVAFARSLAVEIAQLADQGTGKKRVPPEVLEKRFKARQRMEDLIIRNRAQNVRPEWELVAAVFLEDRLISPVWIDPQHVQQATRIRWRGVPNGAMRPLDDAAREVYEAFCESIGSLTGGPTPLRARVTAAGNVLESLPGVGDLDLGEDFRAPEGPSRMSDLEVGSGRGGGRQAKEIRVLGSIAKPALQTVF